MATRRRARFPSVRAAPTQPVLLECSIDAALDAGTRYRVTIGTG